MTYLNGPRAVAGEPSKTRECNLRNLPSIDPALFTSSMRRHASTLTVVATTDDESSYGLAATSFASLSVSPPLILVCLNRTSQAHDVILATRRFTVNLLASEQDEIARSFMQSSLRAERFSKGEWIRSLTGAPTLLGCSVLLDCVVHRSFGVATHTVIIGRVCDAQMSGSAVLPLVYCNGTMGEFRPLSKE